MQPDKWQRVKQIFASASELPERERQAILDRECGADAEVRREVESLLSAVDTPATLPATAMDANSTSLMSSARLEVNQIGPYRVMELLGSGGFGEVYKAERRHPMRQTVAIKVIKLGLDTREIIARFESERQALARMDHPNIAKVLDAGTTDSGRPYFVMEYAPGVPITDFADENKLSIKERLLLFTQACEAISHAHTKALIHRDIKAGNVLAYLSDGKPTVKVIDFGIAKALTGDRLTDQTFNTVRGQVIGTYETMSPEQAEGSPDIDTRTDVYSLGVLLYELLAGVMPFDQATLQKAADQEIRRIIREVEPPRPSTRLASLAEKCIEIAVARRVKPDALSSQLRSELEWIPLKAMRKERDRRYASPLQLAEDIRNYLEGKPLLAGPENRTYALQKFLHRNARGVTASAAVVLLLVAGVTFYIHSIRAERANTLREKLEAEHQEQLAVQTKEFLIQTLQSQDPAQGGKQDMLVTQAMQHAVERLDRGELSDQPALQATLLEAIATILRNNGQGDRALPLTERALETRQRLFNGDHPEVAESLNNLAYVRRALGRASEAEPLYQQALEMNQRLFKGDHPAVASNLNNLAHVRQELGRAAEAEPLYQQSVEMRRRLFKGDHPEVANSLHNLASVRQALGQALEADALCVECLEMRQRLFKGDHPDVAFSLNLLAAVRQELGRVAEAESLYQRGLEMRQRLFNGDHPDVATSLNNLAFVRKALGRAAEAEPLFEQALEMRQRLFKGDHPDVAQGLSNLAIARQALGRAAEAEPLLQQALEMHQRLFKGEHPEVASSLNELAVVRFRLARPEEAELLFARCLEMYQRLFRGDHPKVAASLNNLAHTRQALGRVAQAEPLYREALRMNRARLGSRHAQTYNSVANLAKLLDQTARHAEAAALRAEYGVPDPATQPATAPATSPATLPSSGPS